jgi:hypothetical protein
VYSNPYSCPISMHVSHSKWFLLSLHAVTVHQPVQGRCAHHKSSPTHFTQTHNTSSLSRSLSLHTYLANTLATHSLTHTSSLSLSLYTHIHTRSLSLHTHTSSKTDSSTWTTGGLVRYTPVCAASCDSAVWMESNRT